MHDAALVVRGQHAPQMLALAVACLHVFRAVTHSRVFIADQFCIVFSKKFNIMSAIFVNNRPPCRKKSILAKVCFDANRVSMYMRQNEIIIKIDCH